MLDKYCLDCGIFDKKGSYTVCPHAVCKTVEATEGEDVHISIVTEANVEGAFLFWKKEGEFDDWIGSCYGWHCWTENDSYSLPRYNVDNDIKFSFSFKIAGFYNLENAGRYYLEKANNNSCRMLIVNINMHVHEPQCSSFFFEEHNIMQLACKSKSDRNAGRVWLMIRNDIFSLWPVSSTETIIRGSHIYINFARNYTFNAFYIFSTYKAPVRCVISQIGYCERSCEFPVFLKQSVSEITWEDTRVASFPCCSSTNDLAGIWWYSQPGNLIQLNKTIQHFLVYQTQSQSTEEHGHELTLICGERDIRSVKLNGMGRIYTPAFNEPLSLALSASTDCNVHVDQLAIDEKECPSLCTNTITITRCPFAHDHSNSTANRVCDRVVTVTVTDDSVVNGTLQTTERVTVTDDSVVNGTLQTTERSPFPNGSVSARAHTASTSSRDVNRFQIDTRRLPPNYQPYIADSATLIMGGVLILMTFLLLIGILTCAVDIHFINNRRTKTV